MKAIKRLGLSWLLSATWMALPGFSQPLTDILRETLQLDDLVNEGKYSEATKVANSVLDRLHLVKREDKALPILVYLGKAAVETGQLRLASSILNAAETLDSRPDVDIRYEPALFREKAAFLYAFGQYDAAALAAAKAYRLSKVWNYPEIRSEYCHSIQALALLRKGNILEAKKWALTAVKAAPKSPGKHLVFAPRILYTACVVESHGGNVADAKAFCRLGLQIANHYKQQTRDVSLGHLALAEALLQAGDLSGSREAASKSAALTVKLFGAQHQDMVDALDLLACR